MQDNFFFKKRLQSIFILIFLLFITYGAIIITEYNVIEGFTSIPLAIVWGVTNFYPTVASLDKLPTIMLSLWETILISIGAATVAAMFALVFAVLGSNTTKVNNFFATICRFCATFFRNIDVAVWSMILLFSFGQSALTGYFALFFVSFGFLTRAFIERLMKLVIVV